MHSFYRTLLTMLMITAAGVVGAAPAAAHSRVSVEIETSGNITGPTTASGTFTSNVGRIKDSGTYTETYTLVGDEIHAEKILTGRRGTVTISLHGFLVLQTATTATFRGGEWRILDGTGAYTCLQGGGRPAVAEGSADLAAGTVNVIHRGTARRGRTDDNEHGEQDDPHDNR